jgi:hypothetical protein
MSWHRHCIRYWQKRMNSDEWLSFQKRQHEWLLLITLLHKENLTETDEYIYLQHPQKRQTATRVTSLIHFTPQREHRRLWFHRFIFNPFLCMFHVYISISLFTVKFKVNQRSHSCCRVPFLWMLQVYIFISMHKNGLNINRWNHNLLLLIIDTNDTNDHFVQHMLISVINF